MSTMTPCAKCRRLIYVGAFHTCPDSACYYHIPMSAQQRQASNHLAQPAQAVDVAAIVEAIAAEWDGCEYEGVGESIDVGAAIRKKAFALSGEKAAPVDVEAIREVIADLRTWRDEGTDSMARALTRAISGEKAGRVGGYAALREYVAELPHPVLVAKAHEHIGCARWPDLIAYHHAISGEGEHAYTWKDKPHRLVYNLTRELAYLRNLVCDSLPVSPAPDKEGA